MSLAGGTVSGATFVDEIPDLQATEGNALAQLANVGDGFGRGLLPLVRGRFRLGEDFERACDHLFGRVIAAGAEMGGDELLAMRIESQGQGHDQIYHG